MNKVKIGIVGLGQRACFHGGCVFRDVASEIQMAGLCDNRPDRLAYAKTMYEKEFGYSIPAYGDYHEMFAKGGLDAVYVCGPNHLHRDMSVAAFQSGLHVLCEKPMEVTLTKCDEIMAAARKSGKVLAMGMQMHYRVRYHKVTELIDQGIIGQPAMLWCTEYRSPYIEMKDWVWDKSKSGGAIVEKNCHHYDIMDLWVKGSEPTTVYASGNIMKHKNRSGMVSQIVDNAWIVNDYACGARGMVGICFLAATQHYREFGVQGTEGRIVFSTNDGEILHVEPTDGSTMTYHIQANLRGGIWKDFVDCVRTGKEPLVSGARARKSILIPMAAEKAIEERRVVSVKELR